MDVIQDGPDPRRLSNLSASDRARAVGMLRRGIGACDIFAVLVIKQAGWRELLPDLEQASTARPADFRVRVILALRSLGGERDHTDQLIAALGSRSADARMSAAIGARHFPLERMRAPLLELVRTDPAWLVRHHAAESLLDLADIYPRALHEHPAIYKLLTPPDTSSRSIANLAVLEPPPTPEERAGFVEAAAKLDAAITERLAAGDCAKATPFNSVPLYILPDDEHLAAVVVEQSVGPCERTLAFVVFVRAAGGLGRSFSQGTIGKDPVKTSLQTRAAPLPIEYHRATHSLTVGNLILDTTQTNVAMLSTGDKGVVAQYRSKEDLTFVRHGRPPQTGFDSMVPAQEITDEIRALLKRSPALKALVDPPSR